MTRMLTAIFAALGAVVALSGAQNPAQNKAPQAGPKLTYTGCLRPERFTRPAGSVGAKETVSATYVLSDAFEVKPGVSAATADKRFYKLDGVPAGVDLQKSINHKVEVVGAIVDNPSLSPHATKTLTMQSFKDVAASCP